MKIRKYLLLANIVLTVLVAWTAYVLFTPRSLDRQRGLSPGAAVGQSTEEVKVNRTSVLTEYQSIINQDIFGTLIQKQEAPVAPKQKKEEIKVSRRNLLLKGTMVGQNRQSYAVISDGKAMEGEVFRINDSLQNARIVEILPDRVILDAEGRREALILTYDLGIRGSEAAVTQEPKTQLPQPSERPGIRIPGSRRPMGAR